MFEENKYKKIYYDIINFAKSEIRHKGYDVYYERHHIIPKCMGGDNSKSNLVLLTAREHYICHLLLTKFCTGRGLRQMKNALNFLQNSQTALGYLEQNSRRYARDRERCALRGEDHPTFGTKNPELVKRNIARKGEKRNEEQKKTMSVAQKARVRRVDYVNPSTGTKLSEAQKQHLSKKLSGSGNPAFGKKHSDERHAAFSGKNHPLYGKNHTEEARAKISKAQKGTKLKDENHMYGRVWLFEPTLLQEISVHQDSDEFQTLINNGWVKGRTKKPFKARPRKK